ncbi:MAG TPA: hypothetical protein EYP56_05050 [Planctomycetaceae bacterium]|nr:hypothetical protein [Planctomycetaceae bacterium]
MGEPLDPYWQWLAIPPEEQPPDFYRLLGLQRFESDLQRVDRALRRRRQWVRTRAGGQHSAAARELIERVEAAGRTLLDPVLKRQYDAFLREQGTGGGHARATTGPAAAADGDLVIDQPGAAAPRADGSFPSGSALAKIALVAQHYRPGWRQADRRRFDWPVLAAIALGAMIVTAVAWWLVLLSRADRQGVDRGPVRTAPAPRGTRLSRSPQGRQPRSSRRAQGSRTVEAPKPQQRSTDMGARTRWDRVEAPLGPATMADLMDKASHAQVEAEMVAGQVAMAYRAMKVRDLATARRRLQTAHAIARRPEFVAEVEGTEQVFEAVSAFWEAVEAGMDQLQKGQSRAVGPWQLTAGGGREASVVLDADGRKHRYTRSNMPWQVAVALAEPNLGGDATQRDLAVGAFLAVDIGGDQAQAQQRLKRAGPPGLTLLRTLNSHVAGAPARQPDAAKPPRNTSRQGVAGRPSRSPKGRGD